MDKIINKRTSWNKGLKGWNKGHAVSKETKKKQSESTRLFWQTPAGLLKKQKLSKIMTERLTGKTYEQLYGDKAENIRKKIGDATRGIPKSEEHNRKNSKAHKGKKREPFSDEWKKKLGNATRGKTYEDIYGDRAVEMKEQRSKSLTGRILSKEHRKSISESHKKGMCKHKPECTCLRCRMERGELKGENSPVWKGGISFEAYSINWTETLKKSIRERDKYVCQLCKKLQENYTYHVHHIDYNKKNLDPNNLITLCRKCHGDTNHNRDYWIEYFKNIKK